MIKCEIINKSISCHHCDRNIPLSIRYEFWDVGVLPDNEDLLCSAFTFCEDCSNAMANLHYKVITSESLHQYHLDEIVKAVK